VFDSEAVKTVAIANRLLAERGHPQCDVFWGNEELRTRQLAAEGVFRETNAWTAVGFRSRRLVINTNRMTLAEAPKSLLELTNAAWRGQMAMAYPLFGTTATHLLALRHRWGDAAWVAWCRALQANHPFVVDGNSVVVQFVARGQARIGLTDSDDIAAAQREGAPVAALPLSAESLLIPNTVAVVREAPHPEPAQKLYEFLQRPEVVEQLVAVRALEGGGLGKSAAAGLQPDWSAVLRDLNPATEALKEIFLQ
jgi:iron(III) transport system substrate-binding protein